MKRVASLLKLETLYVLSFSAETKASGDTVKLHLSDTIGGQDVSDDKSPIVLPLLCRFFVRTIHQFLIYLYDTRIIGCKVRNAGPEIHPLHSQHPV